MLLPGLALICISAVAIYYKLALAKLVALQARSGNVSVVAKAEVELSGISPACRSSLPPQVQVEVSV